MSKLVTSFANRVIYFSIKDPKSARSLIDNVLKTPDDNLILPFIDHPGPVSKEILSREFKSLTVCERDSILSHSFNLFVKQRYPLKKVHVHSEDLFDLSYKTSDDLAQKRCSSIAKEIFRETHDKDAQSCEQVKFLVPLLKSRYESGFLRILYYQMCLRLGLCSSLWVNYYFLMSERQHTYLVARPCENMRLYRSSTVLYNTIFKITTLDSYDLRNSFNISLRKIQKTAITNNGSYKKVYLVLLEPKPDIINQMDPRAFIEYRFLVTQMMHKRKSLVFSFLDRFFEHYREDIYRLNIDESTRAGDLSREQYYCLFQYLKNRDDYIKSTFLQAAARLEENVFTL